MRNPLVQDKFYFLLGDSTVKPGILVEVNDRPSTAWCQMVECFKSSDFQMFHHSAVDTNGFTIVKLDELVNTVEQTIALPPPSELES